MKRLSSILFPCVIVLALASLFLSRGASAASLPQRIHRTCNSSGWSTVSSPNPSTSYNTLNGVAAVSANNVWAVGSYNNSTTSIPLIEHWNGSTWKVVTSPAISGNLSGIAAPSANNIWVVGEYRTSLDPQGPYFTLIEHWNGTPWSVVNSPSPGSMASVLTAATFVPGTTNVWSVGYTQDSIYQTLIERHC